MDRNDVATLFAYNRWANHQLLDATAALSPDDFRKNLGASHISVHGTWVHMLHVEWIWVQRWRGESAKGLLTADDFPDLDTIIAKFREVERDQGAFIEKLTDDHLSIRIAYTNRQNERWEYTLGHMIQHTFNHATYHRGQIATFLRQLGQTPPGTDFVQWVDEGT